MFSSDPFQRLTAGGTFNRTFQIFVQRYDLFLIISGFILVPLIAMMVTVFQQVGFSLHTAMGVLVAPQNTTSYNDFDDAFLFNASSTPSSSFTLGAGLEGDDSTTQMDDVPWQFVLEYVVFFCMTFGGNAAMAYAVAELYADRNPSWLDCCKKGFQRWCDIVLAVVLWISVVVGSEMVVLFFAILLFLSGNHVLEFFGCLLILAWLVAFILGSVSMSLLAAVIMVEGTGPVRSIKRCWELSWNNRCYIFCTIFCLCTVYNVIKILLYVIVAASGGEDLVFSPFGAILILFPLWIYLPLVIIASTVVYINIRVQQEGLNKNVLEGDLYGDASITKSKYSLVNRGVAMEVV